MTHSKRALALTLLLTIALALAACGSPATPTVDANTQYTAVAQTVQAELTQAAALTPSATPTLEPTATPPPTATSAVTLAPTAAETATLAAPATPEAAASPDKAEFISQSVVDGTRVQAGSSFTMTWVVRNVGTSTWTTAYQLRHYAGDRLGATAAAFAFPKEVKPLDTVEFTVTMTAPAVNGAYHSIWVLTNEAGVNFYPLDLQMEVTGGTAPGATAAPTAAPTAEQPTAAPTAEQPTAAPTAEQPTAAPTAEPTSGG